MDYIALVIFLGLHYIRPQEWFPWVAALKPVQLSAAIAAATIVFRGQAVRLRDLIRTPHDWFVAAYFAWTVFASPTPRATFSAILPLIFFYVVSVLVLNSTPRIKNFLSWWAAFIVIVSALSLASMIGFDPLDSLRITEGRMKGRLVLNLSIFNNPNALGHALVPAIPILYYVLFWKRLFTKAIIIVLAIPLATIYFTQSKGAFLCAGITVLATLTFGRPRWAQVAMITFAFLFGSTILSTLPRMNELEKSKTDDAIQGRVAAFSFGLEQMRRLTYGHGLGNFQTEFRARGPTRPEKEVISMNGRTQVRWVQRHYTKAPHSAYVQNGADLGYFGFALFIGILYCNVRTLAQARTSSDEEELLRRALFGVVISFAVSSWMVDFCYRPTFFFFTAAVSGLHRILLRTENESEEEAEEESAPALTPPPWMARLEPAGMVGGTPVVAATALAQPEVVNVAPVQRMRDDDDEESEYSEPNTPGLKWDRIQIKDIVLTYVCTEIAIRVWIYAIGHM